MEMIEKLSMAGIVPVIKVNDAAQAVPLCRALSDGGLPVAEITFRSDAAEQAIRNVHDCLPDVILGAGTVLTTEQADRAIAAGAAYIVTPGLNPRVVKHCVERGVPIVPGCSSPSDIEAALELGVHTVKFFPAEAMGGVKAIKAMSAPYGSVKFLPTGGVNEANLLDYLSLAKVVACGGSWMVDQQAMEAGDWQRIERLTRSAVELMLGLELKHVGVNSGSPEAAARDAELLCRLLGWEVKEGGKSVFCGAGFELMKQPFRGTHGHIAIGSHHILRAKWHLERRGFAFDEDSATIKNGALKAIYLKDEVAGFAIHLLQK